MNFADYGPTLDRIVTGNEYMEILVARAADWEARHPTPTEFPPGAIRPRLRLPPLLEWFIRDEDELWVQLPEPQRTPKPEPKPRYYRPASYWRERCDRITVQMDALAAPILPDVAAARGQAIGRKRTARVQERMDSQLARYTALRRKLNHAEGMLRAAEQRESGAA
jgi:hypothetical protein